MKRLLSALVCSVAIATSLATSTASADPPPPGRLGVGDSIMLSASGDLEAYGWSVSAEVGRRFAAGVTIVRRRAEKGTLPKSVIVHLGTNGPIGSGECDELVSAAGSGHRVFLVTVKVPRDWQDANNDALRACAAAFERVYIIRWYAHSRRHPEWFADDGYHVNAEGRTAYSSFLQHRVDSIIADLAARRGLRRP